jgi:hypothetical protein
MVTANLVFDQHLTAYTLGPTLEPELQPNDQIGPKTGKPYKNTHAPI